jgi:hypothetical protein
MNKYTNQEYGVTETAINEGTLVIIDTQANMLAELGERLEILGKRLSPLRNSVPCDQYPEPELPFTSLINNHLRQNNQRICGLINHINLINQEIEL